MECGHQHMAVIAENLQVASSRQRVRGFRQAMEDAGLTLEERWIRESAYHVADGKQTAAALLAESDAPTAVFACNDLLAIGVIQAARERGMAIPRDLSVVGFDNTILATIIDPPLTTIAQPIQEMGKQVVDLVARNIDGQSASKQRFVLLPELIVRGSTAQLNESASG